MISSSILLSLLVFTVACIVVAQYSFVVVGLIVLTLEGGLRILFT